MLRVGVLASGEGTNFQALHDACASGYADAEIACVLTNRPAAGVRRRAERAGVECVVVEPSSAEDREAYDRRLLAELKRFGVELVCGAGYMRLLSAAFVEAYEGNILNIHPSLLPAFPGLRAVEQAWDHGVRVTGATVHVVDAELDNGPIVLQRAVEIRPDDTLETLERRIHLAEYSIYPQALRIWADRAYAVDGRRVSLTAMPPEPPWAGTTPPGIDPAGG